MSLWQDEAAKRLPELRATITSPGVDTPMMLWVELHLKFQNLCERSEPPLDVLRRIWGFALWCLTSTEDKLGTAAALGFCQHLIDREASQRLLPAVMTRENYCRLKGLLLYHNTQEDYQKGLEFFDRAEVAEASARKPKQRGPKPLVSRSGSHLKKAKPRKPNQVARSASKRNRPRVQKGQGKRASKL